MKRIARLHAISYGYGQTHDIEYSKTIFKSKWDSKVICSERNHHDQLLDISLPKALGDLKQLSPDLVEPVKNLFTNWKSAYKYAFLEQDTSFLGKVKILYY